MTTEEIVETFNKKISYDDDIIDKDNEDNEYNSDEEEELFDEYYQDNSINFVEEELVKYVESNFIPLCEYINKDNLEKFLEPILIEE